MHRRWFVHVVCTGGIVLTFAPELSLPAPAKGTDAPSLPPVEVDALSPKIALETPGTVSHIDRRQMDAQLVTTIRQLVRYEPGVSVIGSAGRFGLDSFNIRGLSGNRSQIEIDGVPIPPSFGAAVAGGSFRAGRNFVDMDELSAVNIVRGPVSAIYPSDALGGLVDFRTKDPADYLKSGRRSYYGIKQQYDSTDHSFAATGTFAAGDAHHGLVAVYTHRMGSEASNKGRVGGIGPQRTRPDPQRRASDDLLLKYVHTAGSGRRDWVSVDYQRSQTRTKGLSSIDRATPYYDSNDHSRRIRASVGQDYQNLHGPLASGLSWNAYVQKSRSDTYSHTQTLEIEPPFHPVERFYRNVPQREHVLGARLIATKQLDGALPETIRYGFAASRATDDARAGGYGIDLSTGETGSGKPMMPGNYPLHLSPRSYTDRYALFGEDRLSLGNDRWELTPGLRADRYDYHPEHDVLYQQYNQGYMRRAYPDYHFSPKFGVLWHINQVFSAYLNYAHGYRPPLYSEISGTWNEQPIRGVLNIAYIPNPNLKAETSRDVELGLRGKGRLGWFSIDGYYDRYRNFIWSGYPLDDPGAIPAWVAQIAQGARSNWVFQATNARKAFIKGGEASGALNLGALAGALRGWTMRGNLALATGRLIEPGHSGYSPLNTVDPAKLVAGLDYQARRWGAQADLTAVRRHTRLDRQTFRPPGYALIDMYAHCRIQRHLKLYAGIENLADRKYWDWGSLNGGALGNLVSGNGLNDTGTGGLPADTLSMPGRTYSVAVKMEF